MINGILMNARKRFLAVLIVALCGVVAAILGTIQIMNITTLNEPVHSTELHQQANENPEVSAYLDTQKAYEAHFIKLANSVREEDSRRLSQVVGIVAICSVAIGVAGAFIGVRIFMRPVEEAYASQERFMQDAAHELRNPLAAMTAALQQHREGTDTDRLLHTFKRQTKRLVSITEDLLYLERKQQQERKLSNLHELLSDVVEEIIPVAATKKVKIVLEKSDAVQKKLLPSDYVRLSKNIIENAVKYSRPKGVVNVSQVAHKGYVALIVSDQGIGIPKDQLPMIGQRFFRANNVKTIDGTGLGLAIVMKICRTYGADLKVESTQGKGTTITVKIPS